MSIVVIKCLRFKFAHITQLLRIISVKDLLLPSRKKYDFYCFPQQNLLLNAFVCFPNLLLINLFNDHITQVRVYPRSHDDNVIIITELVTT